MELCSSPAFLAFFDAAVSGLEGPTVLDWGLCVCARTARQATDTYTCILHRHIYMHVVQAHTHHTTPMTHPPRSPTLLQYEVQQHGLLRGAGKRTQALQPQQVAVQSKAEDNRTTGRRDNRRTHSQWVRVVHFNHGHTRARDRSHQTWATNTHDSRRNQSPQCGCRCRVRMPPQVARSSHKFPPVSSLDRRTNPPGLNTTPA